MQATQSTRSDVASLRAFNRIYTERLGLLKTRLDGSDFSLTEARILYEIAQQEGPTAADLSRSLNVDRAQLSRTLKRFRNTGLVASNVSDKNAKQQLLHLTPAGRDAFAALDRSTNAAMAGLLEKLPVRRRRRLVESANRIVSALSDAPDARAFTLRDLKAGDLGWVIHRQAVLYAEEYGWDWTYEALVARIFADFVSEYDGTREQAWIAEADGAIVGSIFLMKSPAPDVAKLRLLYVEPEMRGSGIGRALVDACIERARSAGYSKLELWTNSVLVSARRIYEATGFVLTEETAHHSFGKDLVGQVWELELS